MNNVLTNEDELAFFISSKFNKLSDFAKTTLRNNQSEVVVRKRAEEFKQSLSTERKRLIRQELKLYDVM